MIVPDLEWPSGLVPYKASFYLQPHVGGSESPLTRTIKRYGLSRPRWVSRITFRGGYDGFDDEESRGSRMDAFLAEMEGYKTVGLWDFRRPYPVGLRRYYRQFAGERYSFTGGETFQLGEKFFIPAEAEPMNEDAPAGATEITFAGFKPGEVVFNYGDYFGGDGRAHMILDRTAADAEGRATVRFRPALAADMLAGTAVTVCPQTPMLLTNPDEAGDNETEVGALTVHTLEFVEALA